MGVVRVVTWNVGLCGLRKLVDPHRAGPGGGAAKADAHGVVRRRTFGSLAALLAAAGGDVVCLQEVKLGRGDLTEEVAFCDGWTSFFSCCPGRSGGKGYSGTATFVRSGLLPHGAEEGCTGVLGRGALDGVGAGLAEGEALSGEELRAVDGEGRCVVVEFKGRFVLFNVYAPAICSDDPERQRYKALFLAALRARCDALRRSGRNVVVVGDLNVAPYGVDSCQDAHGTEKGEISASRRWMQAALASGYVDAFRHFHPHRREAYTCFSAATGARLTNFGSRIDHVLVAEAAEGLGAPPLLGALRACDIMGDVDGSDHVPVFCDLDLDFEAAPRAPALCSRRLLAGSLTQGSLRGFVTHRAAAVGPPAAPVPSKAKRKAGGIKAFLVVKERPKKKAAEPPTAEKEKGAPAAVAGAAPREAAGARRACVPAAPSAVNEDAKQKWKEIQRKMAPPKCRGHGEPCKIRKVLKKDSPHVGRLFYVCGRPEGKGKEADCGFFAWAYGRR